MNELNPHSYPSGVSIAQLVNEFDIRLSDPQILYAAGKALDNHPDVEGTRSLAVCRAMAFFGLRSNRQFFYEPLNGFDQLRSVALNNARLYAAHAPRYLLDHVALEFRIFPSAYTAPAGRIPLPQADEHPVGYHAVSLIGFANGGESLGFVNSWGRAWGDQGTGTLSREYWNAHSVEAWLSRYARWGPSAMTWNRLEHARDDREYAAVWGLENPRWRRRIRHNGRNHQLCLWETLSWTECVAEVLEVRDALGFRLGWSELFHEPQGDGPATIVKELFVWPWVRRQGYGGLLLDWAEERARAFGSSQIVVLFHDFDAVVPARAAGRELLQRAGYEWRWRPRGENTLAARGFKRL